MSEETKPVVNGKAPEGEQKKIRLNFFKVQFDAFHKEFKKEQKRDPSESEIQAYFSGMMQALKPFIQEPEEAGEAPTIHMGDKDIPLDRVMSGIMQASAMAMESCSKIIQPAKVQ